MSLERILRAMLVRALPRRIAGEAADDLIENAKRVRQSSGPATAARLLIHESAALIASQVVTWFGRAPLVLATFRRDTAHAWRALTRRKLASAAAALMLAAGLASVAASSGLAAALLVRPVSLRYGHDVIRMASAPRDGPLRLAFSESELQLIRDHLAQTARLAVANLQPVVLRANGVDTQTLAEVIGGPYFDLVGFQSTLGRPLIEADAAPGAPPVIAISEQVWRDRFGRDAAVLGRTVLLNGRAFTVVGVANTASTSSIMGGSVDAWITVAHADAMLDRDWRTNPDRRWWTTLLHLPRNEGADPEIAAVSAALDRASADLRSRFPDAWRERRLLHVPGTVLTGRQREGAITMSLVLTAFALLILAAAAANTSGLWLAAAAAERGRAAIQLAIGSGRAGIIRRHLIEGACIGAAAAIAALWIYAWIRNQLAEIALLPTLSLRLTLPLDAGVVALTAAAGILLGAALALGPALWVTRQDLARTLRDGSSRISSTTGLSRTRRFLVAAQVAISVTLLSGAALFARSMTTLSNLDIGFPRHGLIAFDFDLEPSAPASSMLPPMAREALLRVREVPGVTMTAMSNRAPVDASTPTLAVGQPTGGEPIADVTFYAITDGYFETIGLPLVHGRTFSAGEVDGEQAVAVINEDLASRLRSGSDMLDRPLILHPEGRSVRVVGIARDSKYRSLFEPSRPHIYLPGRPGFGRTLLVRTNDDPRGALRTVQATLDRVGPGVIGFFPRTLDDHLAIDVLTTRASAAATSGLGTLAFVLGATGLYGIVMWFVEIRRREIGVRVALGATPNDVRRLVIGQAVRAAAPGLVVGLTLVVTLTTLGRSLFVGIGVVDPTSLAFATAALIAIVTIASYVPTRRATRVDPIEALKDS